MTHAALDNWVDLDGYAAARNLPDLSQMSIERFSHLVWYWLTNGGDTREVGKLRAKVWRPPAGEVAPAGSPWSAESEMAAFSSLKSALGK